MTQIIVDGGGSWTPAGYKMLRSGIYETNDPALIDQARTSGLDWVNVVDGIHEAAPDNTAQLVVAAPLEDPPVLETGALTTPEIDVPPTQCPYCPDRAPFRTTAALQSHLRARHPDGPHRDPNPDPLRTPAATPADDDQSTLAGEQPSPGAADPA